MCTQCVPSVATRVVAKIYRPFFRLIRLVSGDTNLGSAISAPLRAHPSEVERDGHERMILRQVRLVAPRLARRLSARTLDTPFISDSIPVRARSVG